MKAFTIVTEYQSFDAAYGNIYESGYMTDKEIR